MARTAETVALQAELRSPMARVWQALTDPATLTRWMLFETEDFRPVVGQRFHFRGKAATGWTAVVEGEVLVSEPPSRLSYTWEVGAHRTTVTWTLEDAGDGCTRLHLEQTGFDPAAQQEIGGARYGWTGQLNTLRELLQTSAAGD